MESMHEPFLNALQSQKEEEDFLHLAAQMIADQDMEDFILAQQTEPEPSDEVTERMLGRARSAFRAYETRRRFKRFARRLAQTAAVFAVGVCVTFTIAYTSVRAARDAINNFFLVTFDDHSMVQSGDSLPSGKTMPDGWDGPVLIEWVPERFVDVQEAKAPSCYILTYSNQVFNDTIVINIWSSSMGPNIDLENSVLLDEISIQNVTAQLYSKESSDLLILVIAKNSYTVCIRGNLTQNEITMIAENITF